MVSWLPAAGLAWCALADAATVQILVEPRELQRGQTGRARVIVSYGPTEVVDASQPPVVTAEAGVFVRFANQVARSNRITNGRIQKTVEFMYSVAGVREGAWAVGPAELAVNGVVAASEPVRVVVTEPVARPGGEDFEIFGGFQIDGRTVTDAVVWEGQVLTYRRGLRYRTQTSARFSDPSLDGFRTLQKGQPTEQRYVVEDERGTVNVTEGQLPVVASGAGHHELGPITAAVQIPVGRRFGLVETRTEALATDPLSLTVKPLPPPPAGFSGIVGDVTVRSTARPGTPAVGEGVSFTLVVSGTADLEGLRLPDPVVPGASVYATEPVVKAAVQDGELVASATFSWTLVPTEPGRIEPAPYALVAFSPSKGAYHTTTVPLPAFDVVGAGGEAPTVRAFGADPGELPTDAETPTPPYSWGFSRRVELTPALLATSALGLLPAVGLLGLDAARALTARRRLRRQARAERPLTPSEVLAALPDDPEQQLAVLDHALRLAEAGREGDARIRDLRKRLGRARFGGGAADPGLADDVRRLCAVVEREAA